MTLSIDWGTRVITVPEADLMLVQSSPTTIYKLNLNTFRLWLKDIEDSEEGMPHPDTHRHNTEVLLGGVTYARIIEMINGYTVTFENGQYAVNLVGANSNVGDVVNVNQVSVRSSNSAGLISTPVIEYASFDGAVTVDVVNGVSGTLYPTGTPRQPVDNWSDALLIATYRGFTKFYVRGDATIDSGLDFRNMIFIGESLIKTTLTIDSAAQVENAEFYEAHITGTLDGNAHLFSCRVSDITYVYGVIERCLLEAATITLGGSEPALILNCWSGNEDVGSGGLQYPTIDCGGTGQAVVIRNHNGYIKLTNKTGADHVCIDLNSGIVNLDSTVTGGVIDLRGVGSLIDNSNGATVNRDHLVCNDTIADAVWREIITGATHNTANSAGKRLLQLGDVIDGSVNDVGATTTEFDTTVTGYDDNHFADQSIRFTSGNLQGQVKPIKSYVGSTGHFVLDEALTQAPADGDDFDLVPVHAHPISQIVESILGGAVEGSLTLEQATRLMLSVLTGKSSGGGTTTVTFRDIADSKNRIVATVDDNGNRTAIGTRDGT